jgi:hypothetical protein
LAACAEAFAAKAGLICEKIRLSETTMN